MCIYHVYTYVLFTFILFVLLTQNIMRKLRCELWNYFDRVRRESIAVCRLCKQRLETDRTAALRVHLKKYHNTKCEIWKYFDNIVGEGFAECKECKQRVRNNRSINLTEHIKNSHNIEIFDIESVLKLMKKGTSGDITAASTTDLTETEDTSRSELDNESVEEIPRTFHEVEDENLKKYMDTNNKEKQDNIINSNMKRSINQLPDLNTVQQKRAKNLIGVNLEDKIIKSAVWGLMIEEGVEPSLFSSKNMQALIQPICEAISIQNEKKFIIDEVESERALCLAAEHLRKIFSKDLSWRLLSLKIDMDLNGPEKTFCVSASFIHEGKVQTRILGVIDLLDDAQLKEEHVKEILHKYNIDINQIIFASWDNTKPQYNKFIKNSDYLNEIVNLNEYPEIHLGDIKIERYVGTIAHLCLLDIFKNIDIYQPFLECRNFVKYISNESNGFYDVFKKTNLSLPQLDSPWKWGSTYKMLHDLQKARKALENENYPILELPQDQFTVNDHFWLLVDAFCESLEVMQESITKFYTEEMHFGDCYAQWLKCKVLTEKLATKDNLKNKYVKMFSSELLKCIDMRTKYILSKDAFLACLYLDPRFQHTLGLTEKSKVLDYLKKLCTRSKYYNPDVLLVSTGSSRKSVKPTALNAFNKYVCQDAQKTSSKSDNVFTKLEKLKLPMQSVDTNILLFWDSQKSSDLELAFISNICFAIPTTQNYNKNLYAHIYQTENSSKLHSVTRDNLVAIRLNSHFFEDDIVQFGIFCEEDESL